MRCRRLPIVTLVTAAAVVSSPVVVGAQEPLSERSRFIIPIIARIEPIDSGLPTATLTLSDSVFFDFDQAAVRPDAASTLDVVAEQIKDAGATTLTVEGHTDNKGTDDYNLDLSQRRADAVRVALLERLPDLEVAAEGRGESQPVAPNETPDGEDDPEGRAANRRVELTYTS